MTKIHSIAFLLLCLLLSACSLTKNLPEGETLYRGIKSIDYDKRQQPTDDGQQEGVITALADAYIGASRLKEPVTEDLLCPFPQYPEQSHV